MAKIVALPQIPPRNTNWAAKTEPYYENAVLKMVGEKRLEQELT